MKKSLYCTYLEVEWNKKGMSSFFFLFLEDAIITNATQTRDRMVRGKRPRLASFMSRVAHNKLFSTLTGTKELLK